ncbi:uncharacterized protein LOC135170939 isoform X2 [Diachasmimorpha longicaudata]|uniref:uncharacterized protein LOC135170939 isoform X2 n=1 Tax=Diachasmimorpha longicaudata TaxID=58733 RepID=UPI0030B902FB
MSRAVRKRRKRCPGMPEERLLTQEMLLQTAFAKWEKRLGNLPNSHIYPCAGRQERLAGGGDDDPEADPEGESRVSTTAQEKDSAGKERASTEETPQETTQPEIFIDTVSPGSPASPNAVEFSQGSTGDKEVDEIFDNATQHLREVGKALATLTGNVEHDLKLMLEEATVKIGNWRGAAQSEVDSGINALNDIRKRVVSQNRENEMKVAEAEATKAMYEKVMADSGLKTTIGTDPSYSRIQLPPLQSGGAPPVLVQGHPQTPGGMPPAKVMSQLPPGSQRQADGSVLMPSGAIVPLSAVSSMEIPGSVYGGQLPGVPPGAPEVTGGAFSSPMGANVFDPSAQGSALPPAAISGGALDGTAPPGVGLDSSRPLGGTYAPGAPPGGVFPPGVFPVGAFPPGASPGSVFPPGASPGSAFPPGASPGGAFPPGASPGGAFPPGTSPGGVGPSTIPIEQLALYDGKFQMPTNVPFGQNQREMELEAEVNRLRRENEKIMNERADYENAIQRAILKGVTSLNDEALKVLKNPRMECWTPCLPCNSTDEGKATTRTSTSKLTKDCWTNQRDKSRSILPSKFDVLCRQKPEEKRESSRCRKAPAMNVCYSSPDDKKSSQTNMMWTENSPPPYPRISAGPGSVGSKTICLDGKYRKASSSKDRSMCPAKGNCAAMRQTTQETKRCEPCQRIRKIFDR